MVSLSTDICGTEFEDSEKSKDSTEDSEQSKDTTDDSTTEKKGKSDNLEIVCNITMPTDIDTITCENYKISSKITKNTASVNFLQALCSLENDFLIGVSLKQPHGARMYYQPGEINEKGNQMASAILSFFPKFECDQLDSEMLFVLDRLTI